MKKDSPAEGSRCEREPLSRVAGFVAVVGIEARGPFVVGELERTLDERLERAEVAEG